MKGVIVTFKSKNGNAGQMFTDWASNTSMATIKEGVKSLLDKRSNGATDIRINGVPIDEV